MIAKRKKWDEKRFPGIIEYKNTKKGILFATKECVRQVRADYPSYKVICIDEPRPFDIDIDTFKRLKEASYKDKPEGIYVFHGNADNYGIMKIDRGRFEIAIYPKPDEALTRGKIYIGICGFDFLADFTINKWETFESERVAYIREVPKAHIRYKRKKNA